MPTFASPTCVLCYLKFTERIRGDHHIFTREGVAEILNLQPRANKAKTYQVKQVRGILTGYGLAEEVEAVEPDTEAPTDDGPDFGETEVNDGE